MRCKLYGRANLHFTFCLSIHALPNSLLSKRTTWLTKWNVCRLLVQLDFKQQNLAAKLALSSETWQEVSKSVAFCGTISGSTATTTTTTNNPIARMRANVVLKQMNSRVLVVAAALNLVLVLVTFDKSWAKYVFSLFLTLKLVTCLATTNTNRFRGGRL